MVHYPLTRGRLFLVALATTVWFAAVFAPAPAAAQSATTKYTRVLAREKAARASAKTAPAQLRAIATSYEAITRAHPTSGYADNALWQAAGLLTLAAQRGGDAKDLDQARRLLVWLKKEYPASSLVKQVDARLAAAATARRTAPAAAASAQPVITAAKSVAPAVSPPTPPGPSTLAGGSPSLLAGTSAESPSASAAREPAAAPALVSESSMEDRPAPAPTAEASPVRAVALPPPPPREAAISVKAISHSRLPKGDRLTIELTNEALYSANRAGSPDRLLVDLTNAGTATAVIDRASRLSGTLLRTVSVMKPANESTRLVLELTGQPRYSTFPLYHPFRLVIDIESESPPEPAAAPTPPPAAAGNKTPPAIRKPGGVAPAPATVTNVQPPPPPVTAPAAVAPLPPPTSAASTSKGDYSIARQLGLGVSRIVIDPGHGGHDPGAQAHDVSEAELVLDVSRRLETLLRAQPGFDVVLTRRADEFIPLEERTAVANRESADMFLSIHANASPRPSTRGIETYVLDFATNADDEALAARENATGTQTMRLLPELVKTIALSNKLDESRELARMVQASLVRRLASDAKEFKDLGVKRAPFVVLIGAQMPSVLVEISFLTNRADAALLRQGSHRQRIAQAIADGILKYRSSLKTPPAVATAIK